MIVIKLFLRLYRRKDNHCAIPKQILKLLFINVSLFGVFLKCCIPNSPFLNIYCFEIVLIMVTFASYLENNWFSPGSRD